MNFKYLPLWGIVLFSLFAQYAYAQQKQVLLEWYTSARVPYATDAMAYIEDLKAKYPNFHHVAIHPSGLYYDGMTNDDTDSLTNKFLPGGIPQGMLNRRNDTDGLVIGREHWEKYLLRELQKTPEVSIEIDPTYTKSTRTLSLKVNVKYLDDLSDETFLTVYLVENNVVGNGPPYDQRNYYNNVSGHAYQGKGDPIRNFKHQNVLRQSITGLEGFALGTNAKNDTKTYTHSLSLSNDYEEGEIRLVAFVSYNDTTNKIYDILNSGSVSMIGPCMANIEVDADGKAVQFTANAKNNDSLKWAFGDGKTSTLTDPNHTYDNAGTYKVVLSLYSDGQLCDTFQKQVKTESECQPSFTFQTNDLQVSFNNTSTGNGTSWWWTFGDGNSTNTKSPTHTYATNGTYNICLYNFDDNNDTCGTAKCISIEVGKPVNTKQPTNHGISLYPNPTSGLLFVDALLNQLSEPKFYNSLGQEVLVNQRGHAFDLSALPNGVYLMTFEMNGIVGRMFVLME